MKRYVYLLAILIVVLFFGTVYISYDVSAAASCLIGECCLDSECGDIDVDGVIYSSLGCDTSAVTGQCGSCQVVGECTPAEIGYCEYDTLACQVCCQGPGCGPCAPPECGDGSVQNPPEQCDDGDPADGGPDNNCEWCNFVECGNGIINGGETCDDGNQNNLDGCSSTCQLEGGPWCGNGGTCLSDLDCDNDNPDPDIIEVCSAEGYCIEVDVPTGVPLEECDDGNLTQGDGCFNCLLEGGGPICGDGTCDAGETCTSCAADCGTCPGGTCEDNQIILRLSTDTNAVGETWDGGGDYQSPVCYEDIFGVEFNPGAGPGENQICGVDEDGDGNPDNVVLRLFDSDSDGNTTNAHAENLDENTAGYSDICFGNLVCESIPANAGETCDVLGDGYKEVVSLSSNTNAHLELSGSNAYNDPYVGGYRVCCRGGDIQDVEWQDYAGNKIGQTVGIESYVNRTVLLYAETTFPDTIEVTFEIWENDPRDDDLDMDGSDDEIRTSNVVGPLTANVTNGIVIAPWFITDADMEAGGDGFPFSEQNPWEFYFEASAQGRSNISDVLDTNNQEGPNTNPDANIIAPIHKQAYYTGTEINFTHDSSDVEGPIKSVEWTIEQEGEIYTSTEDSFPLTFGEDFGGEGQATVTLRVVDSNNAEDEDQVAILVISSPGLFTYINDPKHQEIIVNDDLIVMFDASDSYAINSSDELNAGCPVVVTCIAGNCPCETENVPDGCGLNTLPILGCNIIDYNVLDFDWLFDDGMAFEDGPVSGDKVYSSQSSELNDKMIDLMTSYEDVSQGINLDEDTDRMFTLLDASQCLGGHWLITLDDDGEVESMESTVNSDACAGLDGMPGNGDPDNSDTADDCCPGNLPFCGDSDGDGDFECYGGTPLVACSDYETEAECDLDVYKLGDSSDGDPDDPQLEQCETSTDQCNVNQCKCAWEVVDGVSECFLSQQVHNNCDPNNICTEYLCLYSTEIVEECTNGWMIINVVAELIWPDDAGYDFPGCDGNTDTSDCVGGERQIPCGHLVFEHPAY